MFVYNHNINSEQHFATRREGKIMKIVDMKKFVRSIILMFGIIVLLTLIFVNKSFSHSETVYKKIYISSGDTLWNIARLEKNCNEYFMNKEIREIVYELQNINNLKNSELKIGQELSIPTI